MFASSLVEVSAFEASLLDASLFEASLLVASLFDASLLCVTAARDRLTVSVSDASVSKVSMSRLMSFRVFFMRFLLVASVPGVLVLEKLAM
jgi:hypothetical protein